MKNLITFAVVASLFGTPALAQISEPQPPAGTQDPAKPQQEPKPQEKPGTPRENEQQPRQQQQQQQKDQPPQKKMKDGAVEPGMAIDESITLPDLDGTSHTLSDHKGKIVVIDFWSTECPVSRRYQEARTRLYDDYAKQGVVFLAVNSSATDLDEKGADPYAKIRKFLHEHPTPWTVLVDQGNVVADRLGVKVTPHLYVIDEKGIVRYVGAYDDNLTGAQKPDSAKPWVRQAIDALLNHQEPPVASTEPFGCPLKRAVAKPKAVEASEKK